METRRLGRTGHHSTVAILGGAAFARCTPEEAERGFRMAIERGVNHLDIAPSYGHAEVVVGPHVPAVRDRLFVADKTTRRNPDGVKEQLDETLRRLGTDHLDLYQMHAVTTLEVLDERAEAAEVILAAREQGLCRFAGITGHDLTAPATFVEALRRYDLDTVMFPVYPRVWNDPAYRRSAEELLALCAERDLGVMVIKAAAQRPWGEREKWADSWYEPGNDEATITRGVRFALSTPGVHGFCTPGDLGVLPRVLDAAETYAPLSDAERDAAMAEMAGEDVIFPIAVNAR